MVSCRPYPVREAYQQKSWVGTWSTAPQLVEPHNNPPAPGLSGNSLRQLLRVSIGGDSLRVKFSNEFSKSPVTLKAVHIAVSKGGATIDPSTTKALEFNGEAAVTMEPGTAIFSDPLLFELQPRMDVAITIYFGQTSETITGHPGSRTTSYILPGNQVESADFTASVPTEHWYVINGIDVKAAEPAAAVAILGNSITDGRGSTTNLQNRWPDVLSERLLENPGTQKVGVLNMGIGGNCVLGNCLGPSGLSRFKRDILGQAGVRWIIVFEGVNDIGYIPDNTNAAADVASRLIDAYKQMIILAHAKNIRIYGATIMPFKNHSYYTPYRNVARNTVNDWIRNSGWFDAVIDFDKALRNPEDTASLLAVAQSDYLHPNPKGFELMAEAIDLNLFAGADTVFHREFADAESVFLEAECGVQGRDWEIIEDKEASQGRFITARQGMESSSFAPTDKDGLLSLTFKVEKDSSYYLFARLNCSTANNDSFWIKLDNGEFKMYNGLTTNGWEWERLEAMDLAAGEHTLTIGYRENGAKLDKIGVSTNEFAYLLNEQPTLPCQKDND